MSDNQAPVLGVDLNLAPTEEEINLFRQRTFETADRSWLNDRLNVPLPDNLHGEWHGTDASSQFNSKSQGFVDGSKYVPPEMAIHNGPEGFSLGDVKFMVIEKWKFNILREREKFEQDRRSGLNSDVYGDEKRAEARAIGLGVEDERSTGKVIDGDELITQIKR